MKKMLSVALLALSLNGCVAAPLLLTVAGAAMTGYSLYNIGTVRNAKYEYPKSAPSETTTTALRGAQSVAVFPTNTGIDGNVVDIFNERSGYSAISSRKTIANIERHNVTQERILSYPKAERGDELKRFGQSVGADLVVFAHITEAGTTNGLGVIVGRIDGVLTVNCQVYDGRTGQLILNENHKLTFDGKTSPSNNDLAQVAATGIADRLYELRTGEKREQPKKRKLLGDAGPLSMDELVLLD